jgi:hypothetical protein
MGRCAPVRAGVAELGSVAGASAVGVTGATAGLGATTEVVGAGCVHCIGLEVAGLVAALGAALGVERTSDDVARGESSVPARGFLPRLAAAEEEEEVGPRGLPLVVAEAPGLDGFAGMKVRS